MPFAMTLACFAMDMTFEEALVAATMNAAWSLDRARRDRQPRAGQADGRRHRRRARPRSVRVGAPTIRAVSSAADRRRAMQTGTDDPDDRPRLTRPAPRTARARSLSLDADAWRRIGVRAGRRVGASLLMMVAGLPKTRRHAPERPQRRCAPAAVARCDRRAARPTLVDADSRGLRCRSWPRTGCRRRPTRRKRRASAAIQRALARGDRSAARRRCALQRGARPSVDDRRATATARRPATSASPSALLAPALRGARAERRDQPRRVSDAAYVDGVRAESASVSDERGAPARRSRRVLRW